VVDAPSSWQILWLIRVDKVDPPHFDEVVKAAFLLSDLQDNLFSMGRQLHLV
jgi:hypothetical protein